MADGFSIASLVAQIVTGLASGITDISMGTKAWNYNRNANYFNKLSWLYSMMREDTAVQRRVKDLKAAGLSPTLAAGSAASTQGPISLSPMKNQINMDGILSMQQMFQNAAQTELINKQISNVDQQMRLQSEKFPHEIDRIKAETYKTNTIADYEKEKYDYFKVMGYLPSAANMVDSIFMSPVKWVQFLKENARRGGGNPANLVGVDTDNRKNEITIDKLKDMGGSIINNVKRAFHSGKKTYNDPKVIPNKKWYEPR